MQAVLASLKSENLTDIDSGQEMASSLDIFLHRCIVRTRNDPSTSEIDTGNEFRKDRERGGERETEREREREREREQASERDYYSFY